MSAFVAREWRSVGATDAYPPHVTLDAVLDLQANDYLKLSLNHDCPGPSPTFPGTSCTGSITVTKIGIQP